MADPVIALLSDFGTQDAYVGVMKGVLADIAPQARLIDVTHGIPPGDIAAGAFRLWQAANYFPAGTVFLAVVDPGVGTPRRPIAAASSAWSFVGPDNGLMTYLAVRARELEIVELRDPAYHLVPVSATFHARDIFAPAAAHLAAGVPLTRLGPPVADPVQLRLPRLEVIRAEAIAGEVLLVDHFGNLTTSIGQLRIAGDEVELTPWLPGPQPFRARPARPRARLSDGRELPVLHTFGEARPGVALAYVGSDGLLEIGVNRGRAAEALALAPGQEVILRIEG
jgi:S-adenosylmethionine hydrolase